MIAAFGFADITAAWCAFVIHGFWQSTAVAAMALAIVWLLRKRSAAFLYAVLVVALVKFLIPPVIPAPVLEFAGPSGTTADAAKPSSVSASPNDARIAALSAGDAWMDSPSESSTGTKSQTVAGLKGLEPEARLSPITALIQDWKWTFVLVHGLGIALVAIVMANSYRYLRILLRAARRADDKLSKLKNEVAERMKLRRDVDVLFTPGPSAPMALGIFRRRILLPNALSTLEHDELRAILAHELAHHRRMDLVFIWLEHLVLLIWWFNPVAWLLIRAIHRKREDCCDDLVLGMGFAGNSQYCGTLLRAAKRLRRPETPGLVFGCASKLHPLGHRLARIMDSAARRRTALTAPGIAGVALLSLVLLPTFLPVAAEPGGVYATKAEETATNALDPPRVVSLLPSDGEVNVVPGPTTLIIRFDRPMAFRESFVVLDADYPVLLGKPTWNNDQTCTLAVDLKPATLYKIGLNGDGAVNFQSRPGIPLGPVVWTFKTAGTRIGERSRTAAEAGVAPAEVPVPGSAPTAADFLLKVDEEIREHYAKCDSEVQEYIRWTARTFGPPRLWFPHDAFEPLSPDEREQKIVHNADVLQGDYGRHLCAALAESGALKDKRLLPGLIKVASYHREDSDYDCRPKWMAASALGRQDDISVVPALVPLVDHGNQNTRMWARASLVRLTGQNLSADKQAWGQWWNESGHEPKIDLSQLKPWTPPGQSEAGQSTTPSPSQSGAEPTAKAIGRVRGLVANAVTGDPVPGAFVAIDHTGDAGGSNLERFHSEGLYVTTQADEQGRFVLEQVALREDHPFYVTASGFVRHEESVSLNAERPEQVMEVKLVPGASVTVEVQGGADASFGNVLLRLVADDGRRFVAPREDWPAQPYRFESAVEGRCVFEDLAPGRFRVEAVQVRSQVLTFLGSTELELKQGESRPASIQPNPKDTTVTFKVEPDPYEVQGPVFAIGPAIDLPLEPGRFVHPEAAVLGQIIDNAFILDPNPTRPRTIKRLDLAKPIEVKGLPAGSYIAFICSAGLYPNFKSMATYPRCVAFEIREQETIAVQIPWIEPTGPAQGT